MRVRLSLEEGWTTLALLWAMILVSAMAILQADLISGLHIVSIAGSAGILAGLLLAKSRYRNNTAHFFALIYGLFVLFYLLGTTLPDDMLWRERIIDIVERQVTWLQKAFGGGTSRDGLVFVIQTSAIYWVLGYTAAWFTFRTPRVWHAVVPTGVVLLSVVYYYTGPKNLTLYVALYALFALMFVARTHLVAQEKAWRATAVRYERGIWFTFLRAGFLASLIALILAWSLPTMAASNTVSNALSGTRGPWREFQDDWTRLFSALRSYGTNTTDPYQETLVLGGPRTIGSTPIMDIYVPRELPYIYWQAIVYDTYEDGRWSTKKTDSTLHFPDDGFLETPSNDAREEVTQTIVNYLPNSSFIYGAPEIVGSDRQMFVEATVDENGKALVSSLRSRFVLQQGSRYNVTSLVTNIDAQSLREASLDYPQWITDTYLQVPATITAETIDLAQELVAGQETPFDAAIAVRDYLRQAITYNDQIEAPPDGVDPVHYVLFDLSEGYCNYYASAMSMMLRSQGIPSRVVSGYAQGEYNEDVSAYRVRASNAHTWVEVYFPSYGWIQFEPTASIPLVSRPETSGNAGDAFASSNPSPVDRADDGPTLEDNLDDPGRFGDEPIESGPSGFGSSFVLFFQRLSTWQIITGVVILALALATILIANELNRRIESDVERSYTRIGTWARWLGILFRPAQTPYERADLIATAVPEGKVSIRNLTQQFVLKQFSQLHQTDREFDSRQEWRTLRPVLLRQAVLNRLQKWQKRASRR